MMLNTTVDSNLLSFYDKVKMVLGYLDSATLGRLSMETKIAITVIEANPDGDEDEEISKLELESIKDFALAVQSEIQDRSEEEESEINDIADKFIDIAKKNGII